MWFQCLQRSVAFAHRIRQAQDQLRQAQDHLRRNLWARGEPNNDTVHYRPNPEENPTDPTSTADPEDQHPEINIVVDKNSRRPKTQTDRPRPKLSISTISEVKLHFDNILIAV